MITGPTVGPAMLLTVLMRWPALIIVGSVAVGGVIVYKEIDKEYYVTEKMRSYVMKNKNSPARDSTFSPEHVAVKAPEAVPPTVTPKLALAIPKPEPIPEIPVEPAEVKAKTPVRLAQRLTRRLPDTAEHQAELAHIRAMAEIENPTLPSSSPLDVVQTYEPPRAFVPRRAVRLNRYIVRRGDSLSGVVKMLGVPPAKQQDMMYRLLASNPGAFEENNPHRLYSGATLVIPGKP
jgi:hypothetical protein